MTNELQNILSGTQQVGTGTIIQTALNHLRTSQETSALAQTDKHFKIEETKRLVEFIDTQNLWITNIDISLYLSAGAEQKVYLKDDKTVWKLNDSIYYSSWKDYFIILLLNNYFSPDTAYELKGFLKTTDSNK